jgi:hypothetical protein
MMRRGTKCRAHGLAAVLVLAVASLPGVAHAEAPKEGDAAAKPIDEARRRFERGVKFSKDGDFRSALVEFEEAYRVAPNYKVLFQIGQTCEELQDFAGAVRAFKRYLDEGGADIPRQRRSVVASELAQLDGHVARLDVESVEAGVDLIAEGDRRVVLGKTPLADAALLSSGTWEITARKEGFEPQVQQITVAGGDRKKLIVALKAKVEAPPPTVVIAPPPPAPAPVVVPPVPESSRTAAWVGVAVTGALAVGAGVTGGFALAAKSDYDSKLGTFGVRASTISQASDHALALAIGSDVQSGAAIVSAVVTAVLFFRASAPRASQSTGLELVVGPAMVGARGAF